MKVSINGICIKGISSCIPKNQLDLKDLSKQFGELEVERIIKSTGIEKIRIADEGTCASDLCASAANYLMSETHLNPNEIDGLIFVSETPDYIIPATSVILQHKLGLPTSSVVFDINYGCSGYIYGLYLASLLVSSKSCKNVLLLVGDVITPFVNKLDRSLRMILGDAGSASIISEGDEKFSFHIYSDGSGFQALMIPAGSARLPKNDKTSVPIERENGNYRSDEDILMNGLDVFNFAIKEAPKSILEVLNQHGWNKDDVQLYGLHQPNFLIIDFIRKKLKLQFDVIPVAMHDTGNTGPASIPLMLTLEHNNLKEQNRLEKVILCGFGIGLSCASVALSLQSTKITNPIIYEEGLV